MITVQRFIRRKTFLTLSLCAAIGTTASNTYAGFEWIPQKKAEPTIPSPIVQEPVAAEPVPVDDVVLPLPSDNDLAEPVIIAPAPQPAEPAPIVQEPVAAPTRIAITPKEEPNSGAVVSTPPAEEVSLPPLDIAVETSNDDPELLKKPPVDRQNMHIIMPEDAPQSAIQHAEKHSNTITAFPSERELHDTHATPMPAVDGGEIVILPPPAPLAAPVVVSTEFAETVGFAKDVPLALALRQVVPADYAFSFGEGVNPGLRTSWNGGKPWNEVVADMVTPLGYSVIISYKSVRITQQKTSATDLEPALIEPAAGTAEAPETVPETLPKTEESEIMVPINRTREIKRIGITDPGLTEENASNTKDGAPQEQDIVVITAPAQSMDLANITTQNTEKVTFWTAEAGASLRETLSQWSQTAEAELVWDATHDFQLPAEFEVQGSFEKAVDLLLKHGLGEQNQALSHSLATSSNNSATQVIINNAA